MTRRPAKVTADPNNVRVRTPRNKDAISKSLERFGAARSIVVDGDNVVRAGNGTLEQAEAQGLKIKIVDAAADTLIAVRRKDWTPEQARAYAIADNRSAELAEWDEDALYRELGSLAEFEPEILKDLQFDLTDVDAHLRSTEPPDDFPEMDENIDTEHECPKCKYKWSGGKK